MKKNQPRRQDAEVDDLVGGVIAYLRDRKQLDLLPRLALRLSEPAGEEQKILEWIKQTVDKRKAGKLLPLVARRLAEAVRIEGTSEAEVVSAVPLTAAELKRVAAIFDKQLGRKVEVRNRIDPGLKGGFVCRLGDRVIDLSLARRFAELRESLA